MKLQTFDDVHAALLPYVQQTPPIGEAYTLDRIRAVLAELGNPQNNVTVVHIAGTSGKTSTSYYVASMLTQAGCKVGLSVSPHIDEVNERLQINMQPLAELAYCQALDEFLKIVGNGHRLTYFELLVTFAYWYFAREQVDYAVMEVGLGGLLDGTNVIDRPDKVCVITDIGIDHAHILGTTMPEIAAQKAGIITPHSHVFCFDQGAEVMDVITNTARTQQATLHAHKYNAVPDAHLALPAFQRRNWQLAARVFEYIAERDKLSSLDFDGWEATRRTYVPGRMERHECNSKTIILDGAHNPQKMQALAASLKELPDYTSTTLVLAFKKDKDVPASITELKGSAAHVIATGFSSQQDMVHTSLEPEALAAFARQALPEIAIDIAPTMEQAVTAALTTNDTYIVVCGSFYALHEARRVLQSL